MHGTKSERKTVKKSARHPVVKRSNKAPTGIIGFDEITRGGLPRGRTTLLVGGPGSGKTLFSLQFLIHGTRDCKEPGIFVTFEETSQRIIANTEGFNWKLEELVQQKEVFFLNAQPSPELIQSGSFDLNGMLAALDALAKSIRAQRIVFDALDIVLALLPDEAAKRREVYRLHEWLLERGLTGLITVKVDENDNNSPIQSPMEQSFGFMQFMVDCLVKLNHRMSQGMSQRNLRVQKYRGSSFDESDFPFIISDSGFELALIRKIGRLDTLVSREFISSGVKRLDTMLGGGYYRGSSVLITGLPGTAKTTLSCVFTEAACKRGESSMFITFDSDSAEVTHNMASVGIDLNRHVKSGILHMVSARSISGSAESLMARIRKLVWEYKTRCLVIDPVSMLCTIGNEETARGIAERLIDWSKSEGITLVCTSLIDELESKKAVNTQLQVSAITDTWIHLNYLLQAGERNRGLSIVKSRGTKHSNQVRELILSDNGVTLADIYTAGGEVLMGTMRWEKENAERVEDEVAELEEQLKRVTLDAEEAVLEVRAKSLQTELSAKQVEKTLLERTTANRKGQSLRGKKRIQELRGGDDEKPARKGETL